MHVKSHSRLCQHCHVVFGGATMVRRVGGMAVCMMWRRGGEEWCDMLEEWQCGGEEWCDMLEE